jgi:hypothetical protein
MWSIGASNRSASRRLRRLTAGASLIVFPALLVPQALIDPAAGGTGEVMLRAATESAGALTTSAVLLVVSGVLMAPAAAGVLHRARDRGAGLANAGAMLAVLGGFGHFGIAMYYLVALSLPGGDPAEMVAYIDRLNENTALGYVAFPLILCFGLGMLVLPWAAWRAGAAALWAPVVATAVVLAHFVLPESVVPVEAAGLVVLAVVFGYLGVGVLRMTDAEWDGVRTPAPSGDPVPA